MTDILNARHVAASRDAVPVGYWVGPAAGGQWVLDRPYSNQEMTFHPTRAEAVAEAWRVATKESAK